MLKTYSSPGFTHLRPGALQSLPERRVRQFQRHGIRLELSFSLSQVFVDLGLMVQVERDRAIDLRSLKQRVLRLNSFWRVATIKGVDDGVQRNARPGDIEAAVALFDVLARHWITPNPS